MHFIEENARSHSAILTGIRAAMVDSFVSWGNMSRDVLLVQRSLSICIGRELDSLDLPTHIITSGLGPSPKVD